MHSIQYLYSMEIPSKLLELAVNEFSRLPGVGKKTALRYALHLLRTDPAQVKQFSQTMHNLRENIHFCRECHNISDDTLCGICARPSRDRSILCIVQDVRDVMAIENTGFFKGVYHVLGGLISPVDGIAPSQLFLETLPARASAASEVILALSSSMEGETTAFYIARKLQSIPVTISTLARGVAVGDELEYTDELTLGKSLQNRIPYPLNTAISS